MDKLQKIKDKWKYEKYIELEHVDYLIEQAEDNQMLIKRVDEIGTLALSREQSYKNLEKNYRACNYFKKQHYDEMIRLQKENGRCEHAWKIAKTESLEQAVLKKEADIPDDGKEASYRAGAQDTYDDFIELYETSLEGS